MTDYSELVKALRSASTVSTAWENLMRDAAAAIEALKDELEKKRTADCWGCKCEKLEPKRGEWVEDTTTYYVGPGLSNYKCSLCGKICGTWRRGLEPSELPNWCGNCGADMRKMEVQINGFNKK